ncbi:RNA polymerase sigma factor RpoD/SigA [Bacillus sp. AR18-7]|uniref:sigma-70 family RNA polymerase sigma factor n=1 Tax=Bacillus sp. AR18-7 TaxID=2217821 RepID=UPI0011CBDBA2|nr:RNA polymerase sigma factor RpoD/SigA [Bacillus sp. AR18-7]TXR64534.1 RNA polymerase sigma factor RpoD/SigA [Bacillus sp. AR18-7]
MYYHKNSEDMAIYLQQIGEYPLLTLEEERKYLKEYKETGDEFAKQMLINCNLRLVVYIASQFPEAANCELLDCIQEGSLGLIKGIETYDITKETKLSTYATWWIRQAIAKYYSNLQNGIRTPHSRTERKKAIKKCYIENKELNGKLLSAAEIAKILGYRESTVISILEEVKIDKSLDHDGKDEENGEYKHTLSTIPNESVLTPEETLSKDENEYQLDELLFTVLKDREECIIRLRYGIDDGTERTFEDIARVFGLSRERVKQIQDRALVKLNRELRKQNIKSYTEYLNSSY